MRSRFQARTANRCRRPDVHAGRGEIDVLTSTGTAVHPVAAVDRRRNGHVRVSGRIERVGVRPLVAGGGHHHDVLLGDGRDSSFQNGVIRTGQAEIDDINILRRDDVHRANEIEDVGPVVPAATVEGIDGNQLRIRQQPGRPTVPRTNEERGDSSAVDL